MPSFDAVWGEGVLVLPQEDADADERPGRINPRQNVSALHATCLPGTLVELSAVVGGVVAPTDAAISSVFLSRIIEWPGHPGGVRPEIISPVGQSSRVRFRAAGPGHYTVCLLRDGGAKGRFIAHLSCEPS